jgi:hypothetical protein
VEKWIRSPNDNDYAQKRQKTAPSYQDLRGLQAAIYLEKKVGKGLG